MVGAVYLNRPSPIVAVLKRARHLYLMNALLFALIAPLAFFAAPQIVEASGLWVMQENPTSAIFKFLTLQYMPRYLDVLRLYIILLIFTPIIIYLLSFNTWVTVAVSVSAYLLATVFLNPSPQTSPFDGSGWGFNPLAWQLAFVLPMIAGKYKLHRRVFSWLQGKYFVGGAFFFVLAAAAIGRHAGFGIPLNNKELLGASRIIHGLFLLGFYSWALSNMGRFLYSRPLQALAALGRNSLNCFMLSVVTTYLSMLLWLACNPTWLGYLAISGLSVFVVWAGALFWDARKAGFHKPSKAPSLV